MAGLRTRVVGALVFDDPIGARLASFQTMPYLITCFTGLKLLSFVPRPPLRNPALQVAVFLACFALSGLTSASAGALLPLFRQAREFHPYPASSFSSLPVLGLTLLAVRGAPRGVELDAT